MQTTQSLEAVLKKQGYRMTDVRRTLLAYFAAHKKPVSVPEIMGAFSKKKSSVNKTTIYREIEALVGANVITQVFVDQDKAMYELVGRKHHHHAVCEQCGTVIDIDSPSLERALHLLERAAKRKTQFADLRHSLEFFGTCRLCARVKK